MKQKNISRSTVPSLHKFELSHTDFQWVEAGKATRKMLLKLYADEVWQAQRLRNNLIQRPSPKHTTYMIRTHTQSTMVLCHQALSFKNKENRRHIEVLDP